ncbi:hypothetical protein LZ32DRAFT_610588 [Colletotrichum eremochloae]|nr:hypothetical protein LZ32DRAFT_610588 [Colletotrichum eremochloae]
MTLSLSYRAHSHPAGWLYAKCCTHAVALACVDRASARYVSRLPGVRVACFIPPKKIKIKIIKFAIFLIVKKIAYSFGHYHLDFGPLNSVSGPSGPNARPSGRLVCLSITMMDLWSSVLVYTFVCKRPDCFPACCYC